MFRPCFSLAGRTALVTGSTTGLGRATAKCLGLAGAQVAVNYANSKARADEALAALRASGITAEVFQADDTCAQAIEEYDWAFHQQMLDFFVKSPYLLARRALPGMKARKHGRFINITSEVFHLGVAPFSAYVAAKGGQTGWSRSMCHELAPFGITVNMIAPGWIPVERHENDPQKDKDAYLATVPMQRWGKPEEVGWAAVYLASDEASFITGQTIAVNGGRTCW